MAVVDATLPLRISRGFAATEETAYPDRDGLILIEAKVGEPIAIELDPDRTGRFSGLERVGENVRPLPAGSQLDPWTGVFTWLPGPGFKGMFALEFRADHGNSTILQYHIAVTVL